MDNYTVYFVVAILLLLISFGNYFTENMEYAIFFAILSNCELCLALSEEQKRRK